MVMEKIVECPSGLTVEVTKLKVKQLRMLGDTDAVQNGDTFNRFLAECASRIVDPGPAYRESWTPGTVFDWRKALVGYRFAALLGIRSATHGNSFDLTVQCSRCGERYGWTIDLDALPRVLYPASSIEAFVARRELEMKVAGRVLSFRLTTGVEEDRIRGHLDRLKKTDKRTAKHAFDPLIDGAVARIAKLSPEVDDLREWYENLDADDMLRIGAAWDSASGGVETSITSIHSEDPMCRAATEFELPFGSKGFWIPKVEGFAVK